MLLQPICPSCVNFYNEYWQMNMIDMREKRPMTIFSLKLFRIDKIIYVVYHPKTFSRISLRDEFEQYIVLSLSALWIFFIKPYILW